MDVCSCQRSVLAACRCVLEEAGLQVSRATKTNGSTRPSKSKLLASSMCKLALSVDEGLSASLEHSLLSLPLGKGTSFPLDVVPPTAFGQGPCCGGVSPCLCSALPVAGAGFSGAAKPKRALHLSCVLSLPLPLHHV